MRLPNQSVSVRHYTLFSATAIARDESRIHPAQFRKFPPHNRFALLTPPHPGTITCEDIGGCLFLALQCPNLGGGLSSNPDGTYTCSF